MSVVQTVNSVSHGAVLIIFPLNLQTSWLDYRWLLHSRGWKMT